MTIFCTSAPPTVLRLIHSSYTQLCRPQIHFALIKASDVKFVFQVVIQSFYVDVKVSEYSDGDKKGPMDKKKNVLESNYSAPFLKRSTNQYF